MKISIIIPVYNSEKYLSKCLDSLLDQTFNIKECEIIIINDGSTDNSEKIIKKYQKQLNIKYVKQKNHGQSYSRNKGIKEATGKYLTFIDSDDYIDNSMLEKLYNISIKENLDIATCQIAKLKNEKILHLDENLSDDKIKNYILTKIGPCNMLIKRSFLLKNNFSFPENLHKYEDIAVIPILGLKKNVRINKINEDLYFYNDNSISVMNTETYNTFFNDIFDSMTILLTNAKKESNYQTYCEEIEYLFIRHLIMSAGLRYARFNDPENKIIEINNYMQKNFPNWQHNYYLKKSSFKYKTTAFLIKNRMLKIINIIDQIRGKI